MSLEAEQAVLGSLMIQGSAIREIDLLPEDFAYEAHEEIFRAISEALDNGGSADLVTVSYAMQDRRSLERSGGVSYLSELSRNTPSAANIKQYADLVKRDSQKRQALEIADDMRLGIENDGMGAVDDAIKRLMLLGDTSRKSEYTLKEMLRESVDEIESAYKGNEKVVPTNIEVIDRKLGGIIIPRFFVVGARPSMGKTAWAMNIALSTNVPCAFVSGEQPASELGSRMISREGSVDMHDLSRGKVDDSAWAKISAATSKLAERDNIYVLDRSFLHINDVVRYLRKMKHVHDIKVAFVDYAQIIQGSHSEYRMNMIQISTTLAQLRKELGMAIFLLAQVGRECENREDKRPRMSDLKESGQFEQDADTIIFLYRHEVYEPETQSMAGLMENFVAKNRNGPTGNIYLDWRGATMLVQDRLGRWRE